MARLFPFGSFLWAPLVAYLTKFALSAKVLILSVDNRDFNMDVGSVHYPSISAVLNKYYADHHGYDFIYVREVIENLVTNVNKKYSSHNIIPPTDNHKDTASAFHVGLKQFRAASNAKLPGIWYTITRLTKEYDYVFYVDSDAFISPYHINRTIDDLLQSETTKQSVVRGNKNALESLFVFFHNHPWRDDMPCAGTFLFRPKLGEPVIREWWDYDMPSKNFKHFHEQDALWHMVDAPDWGFKLNASTYSILSERQFPSSWKRYEELWLCHVASYNYALRAPILNSALSYVGLLNAEAYKAALSKINVLRVDMFEASEAIEAASVLDPNRLAKFPPHDEATQLEWYGKHTTSNNEPTLPLPVLHENHLIRFQRELWFVRHYQRHAFPNFQTFVDMGFDTDFAFSIKRSEIDLIPLGAPFTENVRDNFLMLTDNVDRRMLSYPAYHKLLVESQFKMNGIDPPYTPHKTDGASHSSGHHHHKGHSTSSGSSSSVSASGGRTDCVAHDELDKLVATDDFKSIMYVVVHNNHSHQIAMKFAACRSSWMRIAYIRSTVYFESILYKDVLLPNLAELQNYKYVITGTYKSMDSKGQTLDEIYRLLKVIKHGNYDIVPFLRSGAKNMEFSTYFHKKEFRTTWDTLLKSLGYSVQQIRAQDDMKGFFRNIFIIRPDLLSKLVTFMNRAMDLGLNDATVKAQLERNAHYREGSTEVAQRIFGTSYYQLHPFVFERLPSFFLHDLGANICHNDTGPCKYNT